MHGHLNIKFITDVSGQPISSLLEVQESSWILDLCRWDQ